MRSLQFDLLIPSSLWLALAVASLAMLAWYAFHPVSILSRRRWIFSIALMALGIALVLAVLLNPTWVTELPPPAGRPMLTILVDATKSMNTREGDSGTRYQAASRIADELSRSLGERFDVRVRAFDESSNDIDVNQLASHVPTGRQTDLAAALNSALQADRPAGQAVALLSDGIDNVGGSVQVLAAARLARAVGAPVYVRTIGSDVGGVDLAVDLKPPQDLVFIGQKVPVAVQVSHVGLKGSHADVSLLKDAKEIERVRVELREDAPAEARFWVRQEKTGVYTYEVRVDPVPGEVTQANNSATYLLRVIDQPVRVLMLEGKPYWDSKFLVRTLSSVPAVELDSVVALTEGRLMRRTLTRVPASQPTTPPTTEPASDEKSEKWQIAKDAAAVLGDPAELKKYQVIVLGRDSEPFLTTAGLANLTQWVSKEGGSLVCYRGSPTVQQNDGLAKLLPVRWSAVRESRFHVQMTEQGRDMNWVTDGGVASAGDALVGLPALATEQKVEKAKPLATVLAVAVGGQEGQGSPAVIYQPYGTGRVVVIEGAGMWRWAFLPPQYQQGEEVYASLWHSLLRWLVSGGQLLPGQKITLRADKVGFADSETATATLIIREGAAGDAKVPTVELLQADKPDAKSFTCSALGEASGAWRVNFGKLPPGRYQARVVGAPPEDSGARTLFDVKSIGPEELDLKPRPDVMARVAEESGGAVLDADAASSVQSKFEEHWARLHPPRYERTTAWDRVWVIAAVFGVWTAAWAIRRSGGLV